MTPIIPLLTGKTGTTEWKTAVPEIVNESIGGGIECTRR